MLSKKICYGSTIGIVAQSSPDDINEIKSSLNFLTSNGFNIKEGLHLYDSNRYLAGKDIDRAIDIMNMFKDNTVDAILCCRGGYGAMRILNLLDYNIIKNNPKPFIGYSDITILLNTFYSKCNLICFHGPMLTSNLKDDFTLQSLMFNIMHGDRPYLISNPPYFPLNSEVKGICDGTLVGGNLCLISSTLGTPYEIDTTNKILFIEDVSEEPYKIDRMLTQLLLANKLQQCSGFIIGQFKNCLPSNPEKSLTLNEILENRIFSLGKPTISNVMSGHDYPKITIPIGAQVRLNAFDCTIKVLEPVVK